MKWGNACGGTWQTGKTCVMWKIIKIWPDKAPISSPLWGLHSVKLWDWAVYLQSHSSLWALFQDFMVTSPREPFALLLLLKSALRKVSDVHPVPIGVILSQKVSRLVSLRSLLITDHDTPGEELPCAATSGRGEGCWKEPRRASVFLPNGRPIFSSHPSLEVKIFSPKQVAENLLFAPRWEWIESTG